ncbi:unnamed protein product, partial [Brassica oleracea]
SALLKTIQCRGQLLRLFKPHNFIHLDDTLILEDESERVQLGV